ncbi:hypothetical protein H1Q59_08220 [Holosporaceae bacterium 'Namur']|nr:hypothetical protein [Holosporaceae bacterium 'Namur']
MFNITTGFERIKYYFSYFSMSSIIEDIKSICNESQLRQFATIAKYATVQA